MTTWYERKAEGGYGARVGGCSHLSASGVDQTPLDDPQKVWRCDACGWLHRFTDGRMVSA